MWSLIRQIDLIEMLVPPVLKGKEETKSKEHCRYILDDVNAKSGNGTQGQEQTRSWFQGPDFRAPWRERERTPELGPRGAK